MTDPINEPMENLGLLSHTIDGKTITVDPPLVKTNKTFTRSDGTVVARIYERLTKASRRKVNAALNDPTSNVWDYTDIDVDEIHYRRGVYDGFKALQKELS